MSLPTPSPFLAYVLVEQSPSRMLFTKSRTFEAQMATFQAKSATLKTKSRILKPKAELFRTKSGIFQSATRLSNQEELFKPKAEHFKPKLLVGTGGSSEPRIPGYGPENRYGELSGSWARHLQKFFSVTQTRHASSKSICSYYCLSAPGLIPRDTSAKNFTLGCDCVRD